MALLVCFHDPGSEMDWSRAAIYLDQSFYEALYRHYEGSESPSPLKAMVAMGYDDEFIIAGDRLRESLLELEQIAGAGRVRHPQIQSFGDVLREAASRGCSLAVGGDMHPDLSRAQ